MIFYFLFSFLIGSIPTAYLVSKLKGIDIKKVGSGNSGATNVLRSVGWKEALFVMIVDISKGALVVYSYKYFSNEVFLKPGLVPILGGLLSVLGHIFSPFLKFNGGKGVATSAGVYLVLTYRACLPAILLSFAITYFTKKASMGTLIAFFMLPIFFLLFDFYRPDGALILFSMIFNILIIFYSHRENIKRIIDGTELKIKDK